jgi:Propanediol utilization protein
MESYESVLKLLLEAVKQAKLTPAEGTKDPAEIPVGVSNRHLHLSQTDMDILFGEGYQMTKIKDLSQPGQFACKETVTICGPNGAIEKVRILGPVRSKTQVEILSGDCFKLGTKSEPRLSGDLQGTPGITIIGPSGSVQTKEGLIVAQRHIHMTLQDAQRFGAYDGQTVSIQIGGPRGGIYNNVAVRANDASALECHIDTEEANAMNVNSLSKIIIIK